MHTSLAPLRLLHLCKMIEQSFQRVRKKHWGSRTLDIDIILYGQLIIHHQSLKIPHPELINRDFVLVPLLEISPQASLPTGESLSDYLKTCESYIL